MNTINVFCPTWHEADSYGRVARELSAALENEGLRVNRYGAHAPDAPRSIAFGGIVLGWPENAYVFGRLPLNGPRIHLTMFESTTLPPGWATTLNSADAVIVPSHWLVEVFRDSGVKAPLYVCPLGVSEAFQYVERPPRREPFTFLAIGDRGRRKGWHLAGFAFQRAFENSMDYRLIYKCRPGALPGISNPNIEVVARDLSDTEMAALYARADCMVFPAAGEGQGLPPLEFAATGGRVIATDWSGCSDYIRYIGEPLRYRMVSAWGSDNFLGGLGDWAEADIDHLSQLMQKIASEPNRSREGLWRANWVRATYDWSRLGAFVRDVWEEVCDARHRVRDAV